MRVPCDHAKTAGARGTCTTMLLLLLLLYYSRAVAVNFTFTTREWLLPWLLLLLKLSKARLLLPKLYRCSMHTHASHSQTSANQTTTSLTPLPPRPPDPQTRNNPQPRLHTAQPGAFDVSATAFSSLPHHSGRSVPKYFSIPAGLASSGRALTFWYASLMSWQYRRRQHACPGVALLRGQKKLNLACLCQVE
jgi:hypothetical protein